MAQDTQHTGTDSHETDTPDQPRPSGAPVPPEGSGADAPQVPAPPAAEDDTRPDRQRTREKTDELMTPDPYPTDPDGGPGRGPSFSSPAAMVGCFFMGFFFGLIGLLVTLLLVWRRDRAVRSRAITYTCLGILSEVVLGTICFTLLGVDPNAIAPVAGGSSSSTSAW